LSIGPTRTFMRWVRAAAKDAAFAVDHAVAAPTRRLVAIEMVLFALIPLFAALMARGIGS
jgi:putative membrane protein